MTHSRDPRTLPVQVSVRMPFWYREQLLRDAKTPITRTIMDAIKMAYPPRPPKSVEEPEEISA